MRRKILVYGLFSLIILSIVGTAVMRLSLTPKGRSTTTGVQFFVGPVVKTIYSSLQVKVAVKDHKIIDVIPITLPNSDTRSITLAHVSVPIMRNEAISKNTGDIHSVSGASVTSSAYRQSLQGALAKAGL
jgi:hypothetical protein